MINKRMVLLSLLAMGLVACGQEKEPAINSSSSVASSEMASSSSAVDLTVGQESAADTSLGTKIIVNKKHFLTADYNNGENPEAGKQVRQLIADMQREGFAISDTYSGFRSYQYQEQLYNGYVAANGQVEADKVSARPGYSEHQTGLAFDIISSRGELLGETNAKEDEAAVEWLHKNMHRYGFVLRYIKGKEAITGYNYEPWHIRYVGQDAEKIYQSALTLEEYYGVTGGNYAN